MLSGISQLPGAEQVSNAISSSISYSWTNFGQQFECVLLGLGILILLITLTIVWVKVTCRRERNSKHYRSLMVDMFVVAKIKQIAEKEGLDLNKELRSYSKIMKRMELKGKDLDVIVEEELNQKIADSNEKAETSDKSESK